MTKNFKRYIVKTFLALILVFPVLLYGKVQAFKIVIDPGHGGDFPGCVYEYDGKTILEKDLNLKISKFMREEFKNYKTKDGQEIGIYLTREGDEDAPGLHERVKKGVETNADLVVSIHNNAHEDKSVKISGAMILVTSSRYNNLYDVEEALAKSILGELNKIGIPTVSGKLAPSVVPDFESKKVLFNSGTKEYRHPIELKEGMLRRLSTDGTTYDNGDTTNWYAIVNEGVLYKIPSIIVENAYLDNEQDYRNFLSTDEKLRKIAKANVRGIAKYYKLICKNSDTFRIISGGEI